MTSTIIGKTKRENLARAVALDRAWARYHKQQTVPLAEWNKFVTGTIVELIGYLPDAPDTAPQHDEPALQGVRAQAGRGGAGGLHGVGGVLDVDAMHPSTRTAKGDARLPTAMGGACGKARVGFVARTIGREVDAGAECGAETSRTGRQRSRVASRVGHDGHSVLVRKAPVEPEVQAPDQEDPFVR